MMLEATELVKFATGLSGWSRTELARAAEVPPSTVTRITSGEIDPKLSTVAKLLDSAGFEISGSTIVGNRDESAVTAAAAIISGRQPTVGQKWLDRWSRAGFFSKRMTPIVTITKVAVQAGQTAPITSRKGARTLRLNVPLPVLFDALTDEGFDFALTGIEAITERMTGQLVASGATGIYVNSVADTAEALESMGLVAKVEPEGRAITLIPMSQLPLEQRDPDEPWRVTDARAFVDAYASPGRAPDSADAYLERFAREYERGAAK